MPYCPKGTAALGFLLSLPALIAAGRSEFGGTDRCVAWGSAGGTTHRGCAPDRSGGWTVGGGWLVGGLGFPSREGIRPAVQPVLMTSNLPIWPEGFSFRPVQPAPRPVGPELRGGFEEPLTTDRPGFSDGVMVMAPGVMQLESGVWVSGYSNGELRERVLTVGSPMLRLGVGHRTEIRLAGDGFRRRSMRSLDASDRVGGVADPSIGLKVSLLPEQRLRPALSVISSASLPLGHSRFRSAGVDPTFKLAWSKGLDRELTAVGNFNVAVPTDRGGRFLQRSLSIQLSRPAWGKWGGFGEAYLISQASRGATGVWAVDGGLSRPIGQDAQFDFSMGQQVALFQRSWFVSAGFVVRRQLWFGGRQ